MQQVNKTSKTLARLAMGTALLTVISGCENRMAPVPGELVSLPAPTVAPVPVQGTSTVVAADTIAPGAPTYTEQTQAANVQTFEAVYGQPVAGDISGVIADSTPYTPPSYDDGTVITQPLGEPVGSVAVYSDPVIFDAPLAPLSVAEPVVYSAAAPVTGTLVYGETLTGSSYIVADEVAAPIATESYDIIETIPYVDALLLTDAMAVVVEPMPMVAEPVFTDGVQIIGADEAMTIYETAPLTPVADALGDQASLGFTTMPMAAPVKPMRIETYSLAATVIETMPVPTPSPLIETTPEPRRKTYQTAALIGNSPAMAPLPRPRPDVYTVFSTPVPQPRPAYNAPARVAPTSGEYVSIGALPDDAGAITPAVVDAIIEAPESQPVREASIRTADADQDAPLLRAGTPDDLSGTSWRLVEIGSAAVSVNAELHFDDSSAFAGGQGPCNSYGGELLSGSGSSFSMANIFATKIACPDSAIEDDYISALRTATGYDVSSGSAGLVLRDGSGKQVARFTAF